MAILLFASNIVLVWVTYNLFLLLRNYHQASKLSLPLIWTPISPDNPLWIALQTALPSIFGRLPFHLFNATRRCRLGWEFHDRYQTHQRLGDVWMLVTPHRNWLYVGEAEAAYSIFSRGRDFGRPLWMIDMLKVFGPNVSTADDAEWQRQRKLTAAPFNEQKSSQVWNESLCQANAMVSSWNLSQQDGVRSTTDDTKTLALHVLAYVGFQKIYPFQSVTAPDPSLRPTSYRDSIAIILRNIFLILILPAWFYDVPFLPKRWKSVGLAIKFFQRYMEDQLIEENQLISEGKPGSGTLMSNLVRTSDESGTWEKGSSHQPLRRDEIFGNIFVFNFAGHDTTATSLIYSILLLAAHPEVQNWIHEELEFYLTGANPDLWEYGGVFPKLKRCRAVLLETLRLYNPLPGIPKYTGAQSQCLHVRDRKIQLPPDTLVVPSLQALHTHPQYWGEDSLAWRPSRWITSVASDAGSRKSNPLLREKLLEPQKGTFIAWSEGIRNCPGKKFSQVEFAATMAALFRNYYSEPAAVGDESLDQARHRVLRVVEDSKVVLLLQMRDAQCVALRWRSRQI